MSSARRRMMMKAGGSAPVYYDYIQSASGAFVDTGIVLPANAVVAVTNVWGSGGSNRILLGASDGTYHTRILHVSASGSTRFGWTYDGGSQANKNFGNFYNPNKLIGTMWITPTAGGYDDTKSVTISKGTHKPNANLFIMAMKENDGLTKYPSKIGSVYVYGSEASGIVKASDLASYTPIASFIPCTYGGQAGYWYEEEGLFRGNAAGVGTLTVSNIE